MTHTSSKFFFFETFVCPDSDYYIWSRIANGTLIGSYRLQYKVYLHQTPYIHSIHTLDYSLILRGF